MTKLCVDEKILKITVNKTFFQLFFIYLAYDMKIFSFLSKFDKFDFFQRFPTRVNEAKIKFFHDFSTRTLFFKCLNSNSTIFFSLEFESNSNEPQNESK